MTELARFAVDAFSITVEVRVSGATASAGGIAEIVSAWSWCRTSPTLVPDVIVVAIVTGPGSRGDEAAVPEEAGVPVVSIKGETVEELADRLTGAITRAAIDAASGRLLLFHAAGIAHRGTGATALLIGRSGAGKSTAVRALGPAFGYVSDETVAIGANGRILSYPKPVSMITSDSIWKRQIAPEALGLTREGSRAFVPARLILLDRHPAAGVPVVRRLSFAEGVERVHSELSYVDRMPRAIAQLKALSDRCGGFLEIRYTEARDLIPVLDSLLSAPTSAALCRASVLEAVTVDGGVLIRDQGGIVRLEGAAAIAWHFLDAPRPLSSLREVMGQGAQPVIDRLLARGLVEWIDVASEAHSVEALVPTSQHS